MKKSMMVGLVLISIFLISGIAGCVPEELEKQVVSELKAKYSNISDCSMSIKETESGIGSELSFFCKEIFIKKPDKYKILGYSTCEKYPSKMSTFIYAGNTSLSQEYNPKTNQLTLEMTKMTYPYDIGKNMVGEFFFENLVRNILKPNTEISLIGEERYKPLGLEMYHLRVQVPEENFSADLWIDKETYIMVKLEGTEEGRYTSLEIEKLELNKGLPDSVFEPATGISVVERPSEVDSATQHCENICKNKDTVCQQGAKGFEAKYYAYCIEKTFVPGFKEEPTCWEDPINVECPEIDCNKVLDVVNC